MVSMDKVQRGVATFLDRELMPTLEGWDKVLVGGGAGLAVAKLPKIINMYPIASTLEIYDKASNQVDIDALYNAVMPYMGENALPLKIPYLGLTMKIGKPQIETLYKYIKEV